MAQVPEGTARFDLSNFKGEMWALLAAVAYAVSSLFSRVAVRDYPLSFMWGVSVRALPIFLFALLMTTRLRRRAERRESLLHDWQLAAMMVCYGLVTFLIGNPLLLKALQLGGVRIATPVAGTTSLWAAMLAALLLGQALNGKMLSGILASIAGIVVLTLGQGSGSRASSDGLLAVPLALGTAVSWAFSGVLMAGVLRRGVDRFDALTVATGSGIVMLNVYLLVTGDLGNYLTTPVWVYGALFAAGVLNALALVSITTALTLTSVATTTTLNSLQIALGPVLAWIFLGEGLGWMTALGVVFVAAGAVVVQQGGANPRRA